MFRLAICDDDTLHMQNTLRCARELSLIHI